jgi:hypothetical protein
MVNQAPPEQSWDNECAAKPPAWPHLWSLKHNSYLDYLIIKYLLPPSPNFLFI